MSKILAVGEKIVYRGRIWEILAISSKGATLLFNCTTTTYVYTEQFDELTTQTEMLRRVWSTSPSVCNTLLLGGFAMWLAASYIGNSIFLWAVGLSLIVLGLTIGNHTYPEFGDEKK